MIYLWDTKGEWVHYRTQTKNSKHKIWRVWQIWGEDLMKMIVFLGIINPQISTHKSLDLWTSERLKKLWDTKGGYKNYPTLLPHGWWSHSQGCCNFPPPGAQWSRRASYVPIASRRCRRPEKNSGTSCDWLVGGVGGGVMLCFNYDSGWLGGWVVVFFCCCYHISLLGWTLKMTKYVHVVCISMPSHESWIKNNMLINIKGYPRRYLMNVSP